MILYKDIVMIHLTDTATQHLVLFEDCTNPPGEPAPAALHGAHLRD
jgi:hypothetical protein